MRISDWRSDLCSSDLELWEPGERPKAHSRQEGEAVRPRHRKSGSSVIAWTKSRPSRSWLRASTSSSFAARGVDLNGLVTFVNLDDRLNERVGRRVAWMTLLMGLFTLSVAILRYFNGLGWAWVQGSYVWLHGIDFLDCSGF